jgi:hypothetical protein
METVNSAQDLSIQHEQIKNIVEEYQDVLVAPTGVHPNYPVNQVYNKTLHTIHESYSST